MVISIEADINEIIKKWSEEDNTEPDLWYFQYRIWVVKYTIYGHLISRERIITPWMGPHPSKGAAWDAARKYNPNSALSRGGQCDGCTYYVSNAPGN